MDNSQWKKIEQSATEIKILSNTLNKLLDEIKTISDNKENLEYEIRHLNLAITACSGSSHEIFPKMKGLSDHYKQNLLIEEYKLIENIDPTFFNNIVENSKDAKKTKNIKDTLETKLIENKETSEKLEEKIEEKLEAVEKIKILLEEKVKISSLSTDASSSVSIECSDDNTYSV